MSTILSYANSVSMAGTYSTLLSSLNSSSSYSSSSASSSSASSLINTYNSSLSASSMSSLLNMYYSAAASRSYYSGLSSTSASSSASSSYTESYYEKLSSNASDLQDSIDKLSLSSTYNDDDIKVQLNAARDLVNSYNALMKTAKEGSTSVQEKLLTAVDTYSEGLVNIGVYMNENGYLEIDEDMMEEAAENGKLEDFFKPANSSSAFLLRLDFISQNIENSSYSDSTASASYSSSAAQQSYSPYMIKKYTSLYATNMLLNAMF